MSAVLLALTAALLFGTGIAVQATALARPRAARGLWLLGTLLDGLGTLSHVAALHFGSLAVVQPLTLSAIAVAVPVESLLARRRHDGRRLVAAVQTGAGLGLVAALLGASGSTVGTGSPYLAALVGAAVVALPLATVRVVSTPAAQALGLGIAAGGCFGLSATVVHAIGRGPFDGLPGMGAVLVPGLVALTVGTAGVLLSQVALRSSHLSSSMPAQDFTALVTSIGVGAVLLGEVPAVGLPTLAAVAAAAALVVTGARRLQRGAPDRLLRTRPGHDASRVPVGAEAGKESRRVTSPRGDDPSHDGLRGPPVPGLRAGSMNPLWWKSTLGIK